MAGPRILVAGERWRGAVEGCLCGPVQYLGTYRAACFRSGPNREFQGKAACARACRVSTSVLLGGRWRDRGSTGSEGEG